MAIADVHSDLRRRDLLILYAVDMHGRISVCQTAVLIQQSSNDEEHSMNNSEIPIKTDAELEYR